MGEYSSILDIFAQSCQKFGKQTAYMNFGKELNYHDLDRLTHDFAAWLQSKGLVKGDRIALMMPNILQYPVALFGAMRAGLVIVNTNPMYTARELKHQLTDSGARAIVVV
ncbi:MAG: AMP-binding protein, partial [Xanthomonadales bacterium]|nr:AMP-binding protein [Xanthomonadales bacterium]